MSCAFVTGSHIYGTPNKESDVDLVVPTTVYEREKLLALLDLSMEGVTKSEEACQFKVGNLNLICVDEYVANAWRRARDRLLREKPTTRERAIVVTKQELKEVGTDADWYDGE